MSSHVNLKLLFWKVVNLSCKVVKIELKVVNFYVVTCKFKTLRLKSCKFKL
jgi:hypothetical protein